MRVGYLGLGLMGARMAANLLKAGHDVTVWNRTAERSVPLAALGAAVAVDPADAGVNVDAVCACLPDGAVLAEVLFGANGGLTRARPGTVVVDHSTIDPADARAISERCSGAGLDFLDAPVSGGPQGAEAGTLAIFVGGESEALERARPAMESYAACIVHMGGPGQGQVAKLANQMCVALTFLGIAEAFAYAQHRGVDPGKLLEVLSAATADSVMLRTRVPVADLQPGMPASNGWLPGFAAGHMVKDLDFALADAAGAGAQVAGTRLVRAALERAMQAGHGNDDWTVLSCYLGDTGLGAPLES